MFILTAEEFHNLRSQSVTSSWGGDRYPPMAFTQQGVAMGSSVINTPKAMAVNIWIKRVFIKRSDMISSYQVLLKREQKLEDADFKKDDQIQ